MRQVIYADVLVFLNTAVTFLLLLTVRLIAGTPTKAVRLAIASFIGGLSSLLLLAPPLPLLLTVPARLAVGMAIVRAAFPAGGKKLLRSYCVFMGVSFGYGGALYALRLSLGEALTVRNGYGYYEFSATSLILATVVLYTVLRLIHRFILRKNQTDHIYDLTLSAAGKTVTLKALMDSGHTVRDIYTGNPVVILSAVYAEKLVGSVQQDIFAETALRSSFGVPLRFIPVHTISGERCLPAFSADRAVTHGDAFEKESKHITVAVTEDPLGGERYQALMNDEMM